MAKCDLDSCSLTGMIEDIKDSQEEMKESHQDMVLDQALLIQKIDTYIEHGKEEHAALFARTKLVVKWPHLGGALAGVGGFVTLVWNLTKMSGGK